MPRVAFMAKLVVKPSKGSRPCLSFWVILGGAIQGPFLRILAILLLLSPAISLIMPETANAQFWVSAGFKPSSDAQHITAYCSTSDADPASGQLSPVATEYWDEIVACKVTTSSGQVVAHDPIHCAIPSEGNGEGAEVGLDALPQTATCTFNIQVQFGVTYFVNSWHYIYLSSTETPADQCFYRISEFVQVDWCVSDPQGYSNWPVSQGLNAEDPSLY